MFSIFTVTVFDANSCPGSLINHGFVLYFAHLGFFKNFLIVWILHITRMIFWLYKLFYYMYDLLGWQALVELLET